MPEDSLKHVGDGSMGRVLMRQPGLSVQLKEVVGRNLEISRLRIQTHFLHPSFEYLF